MGYFSVPYFHVPHLRQPNTTCSQEQVAATAPMSPDGGELMLTKALVLTLQTRYLLKPVPKYSKNQEPPKDTETLVYFSHWTTT